MIALQSTLFTALAGYAGLSALVGTRVYPDGAVPQGVANRPFVVWLEYSLTQASDLGGSAATSGLNNYHVQVSSYAATATLAREIDYQVQLAMQAATTFKSLLQDARSVGFDADAKLYGAQSDFSVWLKT